LEERTWLRIMRLNKDVGRAYRSLKERHGSGECVAQPSQLTMRKEKMGGDPYHDSRGQ